MIAGDLSGGPEGGLAVDAQAGQAAAELEAGRLRGGKAGSQGPVGVAQLEPLDQLRVVQAAGLQVVQGLGGCLRVAW